MSPRQLCGLIAGTAVLLLNSVTILADNYVAGANYSNGQLYALCFDDELGVASRSSWSADGGTKPSSLVFHTGPVEELGKEQLQLFVADNAGTIRRFSWGEAYTVGEEPEKDCDAIQISPLTDLYPQPNGEGLTTPDGLVITNELQLIALNTGDASSTPGIWRFDLTNSPAANAVALSPELVLADLPYTSFSEALLLPSNMSDSSLHGDLLVVAKGPDAILRIDSSCLAPGSTQCSDWSEMIGASQTTNLVGEPAGLALLPSPYQDRLLLSTQGGILAVYNLSSGSAELENPTLVSDLGAGKFKIKTARKVAIDDAASSRLVTFSANVYVAGRNNGSIQQLTLEVINNALAIAPTPILEVNVGIEHPRGLATTSDDFIRIVPCTENCPDEITVDISTVIQHQFDVSSATGESVSGYIGETYEVLKDPRLGCVGTATETNPGPLYIWNQHAYLYDPSSDNSSVMIPEHLCGSPAEDPHIIVVKALSNVDPTKIQLRHRVFDTDFDDNGTKDLDCFTSDVSMLPAVGWTPIPNSDEDTIVEGNQVIDLISGCGSLRLKTRTLSYFILGLRNQLINASDGKPGKGKNSNIAKAQFTQLLHTEFDYLAQTLNEANSAPLCVGNSATLTETLDDIEAIQTDLARARLRKLEPQILSLLMKLRDNDNHLMLAPKNAGCEKNYIGDVQARATHLYFSAATKLFGQTWTPGCEEDIYIESCLQ